MKSKEEMINLDFMSLSNPPSCGEVDQKTGRRRQKHKGEWVYEFIFLSDRDPSFKMNIFETIKGDKDMWIRVINLYLRSYGFQHPIPTIYCYNCETGMISSRQINLEFNLVKV